MRLVMRFLAILGRSEQAQDEWLQFAVCSKKIVDDGGYQAAR
ncbi:hypothetical protein Thiowin_01428 [Thiorhodovibrio winogradskyi]|uniref:Uncharacterized protein n=1 Tax=Thiorhodovibrio winogradskyi TaxID=77007 RepID=A0ABZ0S7K3_9GAMM